MSSPPESPSQAELLFARYGSAVERGDAPDFDAWLKAQPEVRENPELADQVRRLRSLDARVGPDALVSLDHALPVSVVACPRSRH